MECCYQDVFRLLIICEPYDHAIIDEYDEVCFWDCRYWYAQWWVGLPVFCYGGGSACVVARLKDSPKDPSHPAGRWSCRCGWQGPNAHGVSGLPVDFVREVRIQCTSRAKTMTEVTDHVRAMAVAVETQGQGVSTGKYSVAAAGPRSVMCFNCGQVGHMRHDCPRRYAAGGRSRDSPRMRCFRCQQISHMKKDCPQPKPDVGDVANSDSKMPVKSSDLVRFTVSVQPEAEDDDCHDVTHCDESSLRSCWQLQNNVNEYFVVSLFSKASQQALTQIGLFLSFFYDIRFPSCPSVRGQVTMAHCHVLRVLASMREEKQAASSGCSFPQYSWDLMFVKTKLILLSPSFHTNEGSVSFSLVITYRKVI